MVRCICERQKSAEPPERETGLSHRSDIGPGDYLSDEEVRQCRAVLSDEERGIFELMLGSGLQAGVKTLKPHRMRHSYATNFLNSGGGIEHLQSQLGHEHLSTTQNYAKSLEKAIRPAIDHDRL